MIRQVLFIGVGLSCIFALSAFGFAQELDAESKSKDPATLMVTVVDQASKPLSGASVDLLTWSGTWDKTNFSGKTNAKGQFKFDGFKPAGYMTVLVKRSGFASVMQDFSPSPGSDGSMTCKLLPAVNSWIRVTAPDGNPLRGAEITRLEVSSPLSKSKMVFSSDMYPMLAEGSFKSDLNGRTILPPLPEGSTVSMEVLHPEWAVKRVVDLKVVDGKLTNVSLDSGTRVSVKFHGDPNVVESLDGKQIEVRAFSRQEGVGRVIHRFTAGDGRVGFGLHPGQFDQIDLSAEGVLITPKIPGTIFTFGFLKFEGEQVQKNFVVRSTKKVRGRVVTSNGKPAANVWVFVDALNLYADEITGEQKTLEKLRWATCAYVSTDEKGFYEAEIPNGKIRVKLSSSDYYAEPESLDVEFDGADRLPDLLVRPMPVIRGVVLDDNGQAKPNAILRELDGVETKYYVSDGKGEFSIPIGRFAYNTSTSKRIFKKRLMAFDTNSLLSGIVEVDLQDPASYEQCIVNLKDHPANWVIEQLESANQLPESMADIREKFEKEVQKLREKYPAGEVGNLVNDLSSGTWLNTDARSLKDFRGKYVLLDFWFIGCGPCMRDMPSVKLAQKLYGPKGFSVVSVHLSSQKPNQVKQFAEANGMNFPIVVDNTDDEIIKSYEQQGVASYPSYILLGPDGRIVSNDQVGDTSLRMLKIEIIRREMLKAGKEKIQDK